MNIVLISLVPLRADRVSGFGYERDTTPGLDEFASDATTFLNAYATAPWTPPSYSSVITGRYPWNTGVVGPASLPAQYPTIAGHLGEAGFRTAAFVTAHHVGPHRAMERGFSEFSQVGAGAKNKGSVEATARAMKWLDEASRDSRPFFLTVHYHEAHLPYLPPSGHRGRYTNMRKVRGNADVELAGRQPHAYMMGTPRKDTLRLLSDLYDDEVAYLDRQHVGPLLAHIAELGLLDNTIVVVVSLHGDSLGEHGLLAHAELYEPTVHVPLIIRHPAKLRGARIADLVQLTDLFPTLLQFVGVAAPEQLDGWPIHAFVPPAARRTFVAAHWVGGDVPRWRRLLRSGTPPPAEFVARFTTAQLMLRAGRFKYISGPDEQLYDLISDPGELVNLAEKHPRQAASLNGQLARLVANSVEVAPTKPPPPDVARDLRRMGYRS